MKQNVRYIEGLNTLGVDLSDQMHKMILVTDELHIQKVKGIDFKMRSKMYTSIYTTL
jgi:cytochrome c oxidase subunit 2